MDINIKNKLDDLPRSFGVYKFFDKNGKILYIGKAANLKNRVSSYFFDKLFDRPRIIQMIPLIQDIEVVQTDNEIEALVLESALIKKHQPHFNSTAKDDKSFAYLFINTKDEYPTVKIVRNISEVQLNRGKIFGPYPSGRAISQVFNFLRKMYPFCTDNPLKPCFYSYIGLCPYPDTDKQHYRKNINGIVAFLNGKKSRYIKNLEKEMAQLSKDQNFEKAAQLRDRIDDLRYLSSKINYTYQNTEQEYVEKRNTRLQNEVKELGVEIGISNLRRIECFDISNISGTNAYGSMAVSIDGAPKTNLYRLFKIKGIDTPDDPHMMLEVIQRRLKHIETDKDKSLREKPGLILIDGGISQLNTIKEQIPADIPVMGISKGKRLKRKGKGQKDEFWVIKGNIVFPFKINNPTPLILLRDEAHRFAITAHRRARKFTQKHSVLDEIGGVGSITKRKLLNAFTNIEGIKNATEGELLTVIKSKTAVKNIKNTLK
ncbi:excinuclease ABC subunit UvrC [Candidatus Dojkabacteria bacterium]|nr:excinuclease ABC subunit UvrC [Candidatus Dojkabacteria bacterium]